MISLTLARLIDKFSKKLNINKKEIITTESIEDLKNSILSSEDIKIFAKIKEVQKLEEKLLKKINISLMEEIAKENNEKELLANKIEQGEEVISKNGILNETEENKRKKKNLSDPSINFKSISFSLDGPGM